MSEQMIEIIIDSYRGYWHYLREEILHPGWHDYFYWLTGLSLFAWLLEYLLPWRKKQSLIRKDFWMDVFYMYFNFFLFSLIAFNAISNLSEAFLRELIHSAGVHSVTLFNISRWPAWMQLLSLFFLSDFIQWNVHLLLHRVPFLWEFHKVHHSVKEMGFAAHLRYHWAETILYKSTLYVFMSFIGFSVRDFFIVHIIQILIGHLNHSNVRLDYGILKYLQNNPGMHIWHHAKRLPARYGVNFGISLSLWDYIFGTAYLPHSGRDIELGFAGEESFPATFFRQIAYPLSVNKSVEASENPHLNKR